MVFPHENSFLSNRVNLNWGETTDDHEYDCTCDWCPRFKIPCRHVIAAWKGAKRNTRVPALVRAPPALVLCR